MRERKADIERTPEFLAAFMPDLGGKRYRRIPMIAEEVAERRSYIRHKLINSTFCNLTNDELDNSLYYELGDKRIFENPKGYSYVLSGITKDDREFRKVRAMMPFEYIGLRTKDFQWDVYAEDVGEIKKTLNHYLLNFSTMSEKGMGLYIYSGTKGSGKTMLSCCILNEIADKHAVNVKFINILDLLEMTKKSYSQESGELLSIENAAVLVLDDIGVQMSKEWVDTVLYRLVNARYCEHRATIYTSNVKIENLKIDERIKDRIESTSFLVALPEVPVRRMQGEYKKQQLLDSLQKNTPSGATNTRQGNM